VSSHLAKNGREDAETRESLEDLEDVREIEEVPLDQRLSFASVYDMFASTAAAVPWVTALRFIQDAEAPKETRCLSMRELFRRITQSANLFTRLGASRENSVALLMPSTVEMQFALWGAEAASIAVPINFLLTVDHICDILKAAKAEVLVAFGPDPALPDPWQKAIEVKKRLPKLCLLCVPGVGGLPIGQENFTALLEPGKRRRAGRFRWSSTASDSRLLSHWRDYGRSKARAAQSCQSDLLGVGLYASFPL
jgi:fatty-acyl-CoA synthase